MDFFYELSLPAEFVNCTFNFLKIVYRLTQLSASSRRRGIILGKWESYCVKLYVILYCEGKSTYLLISTIDL